MGLLFVMGTLRESQSAGDDGTIPQLSLNYAISDEWSAYAVIRRGLPPGRHQSRRYFGRSAVRR